MKQYHYLIVEGQHDIAFVARLLKALNIRQVTKKSVLDQFWDVLIPKNFPVQDDLLKRVPVPAFFENDTHSIAVHSARGITRLTETLGETLSLISQERFASHGFLLDADQEQSPDERFEALITELKANNFTVPAGLRLGEVSGSKPAFGVYILPDNQNKGTLEDVLLQTAQVNYAQLSSVAQTYIQAIDQNQLTTDDLDEFKKPAGTKKAQISAMSSVLKPGKAIQNSIQDNRWLDGEAIDLPIIKSITTFLAALFDLP